MTPTLFDEMEREEQAACVVYAVERRRQDIEDLSEAVAFAFSRVLANAFGKGEDDEGDDGGTVYVGHNPLTGERTEDGRG